MDARIKKMQLHHPLDAHEQKIEELGALVIDDVTEMPIYGEPYVSPLLVIGINHSGYVKSEYDMQDVEFRTHELAVVYPDHTLMAKEASPDYRATLIVISRRILLELHHRSPHRYLMEYIKKPDFHLSDEQYSTLMKVVDVLHRVLDMDVPSRESMMVNLLDFFSQLIDTYRFGDKELPQKTSTSRLLFYRFYDAIVEHYHESHEVAYYADLLCLSPKYFASQIKKETGIQASTWIYRYLIIQAKSLLRNRALNNQQISDLLGFPEQSSFSRFFKVHTGLSPTDFRKQQE